MPPRLSAVEAVTPAFEQTKQQLFKPFRFWHWTRLAVVALTTGEFAGGGGGGGGFPGNIPQSRGKRDLLFAAASDFSWQRLFEYLPWIILGVGLLIALVLLWLYCASVYRFVLFDSVLNNRCELRAGWRRWQAQGNSYFLWSLCLGLGAPLAALLLIGGPILAAWQAGVFRAPKEHLALLIVGGIVLFFLLLGLIFLTALVTVLAKDFAVPVMALENLGILDAWRRVLPMLRAEKMSYVGYVLMKIVLAVGSAILFGILNLLALLVLLIPLGAAGVAAYVFWEAADLSWNAATVCLVVALGSLVLAVLLFIFAFISSPSLVFFQSYALHFLGSRYPALGARMAPPPPPPAVAPEASPAPAG